MAGNSKYQAENFEKCILTFCRHIANSRSIAAICLCSSPVLGNLEKTPLEVLLIVDGFKPRLMNYIKFFHDKAVIVYAVDKWVFEKDVERGFLGETLAIQLLFPYKPLVNAEYLKFEELKLKKRLIHEILENLVLDFPDLCHEIHIKPEYFAYEAMHSRARLFPPIRYMLSNLLRKNAEKGNMQSIMEGFLQALEAVEKENVITRTNGYIKISKDFADTVKSRKIRFTNLLKTAQKTLFMSLLGTFPKILTALSQNKDLLQRLRKFNWKMLKSSHHIEDSKRYLFVPTAEGLVPLATKVNVEDFVKKILSANRDAHVSIEELGGALNDVYLVKVYANGEERKAVVKTFKDWSSFKWLPINIWAFGTRTFALLGRTRLERECVTNQFLYRKGFHVPKLLGVNHDERLVFMEYIEGKNLEKIIRKIVSAKNDREIGKKCGKYLKVLQRVGETFARVHALNVTLGDTKPENILIGKNGEIYLLDLEQSSRGGDKAWDIAEFLYYTGHYVPPFASPHSAELIAKAFLKGYLSAGGDIKAVKDAGKPKYTKVFSVFVFPHIIFTISNICRRADELGLMDD
ncbi:MAG: lipopolysaccharide kinase InaA family protein [Candidatus Bathyarchaeia archaeon]